MRAVTHGILINPGCRNFDVVDLCQHLYRGLNAGAVRLNCSKRQKPTGVPSVGGDVDSSITPGILQDMLNWFVLCALLARI